MKDYLNYYMDYIGYCHNNDAVCVKSYYRSKPIHKKYFYPIIITEVDNRLICSSTEELFEICCENFDGTIESVNTLVTALGTEYAERYMLRLTYDKTELLESKAIAVTEELLDNINLRDGFTKEGYLINNATSIKDSREFFMIEDNNIAARGLISDVYEGGCNIVVYTFPEYRSKGYGKEVVKACINWCTDHNLRPIYCVDQNNVISIRLASVLGFNLKNKEVIVQRI